MSTGVFWFYAYGIFMAFFVGFFVFSGIRTNYFLNDDLPAHIAVIKELDDVGASFGNPFLADTGLPDLHTGPYHLAVYIIEKIFHPDFVNFNLNPRVEQIISSFLILGFISIVIFLRAYVLLLKNIADSKVFIFLGTGIFLLTSDLPLLRWAGNVSLHGISYQFYYPEIVIFFHLSPQIKISEIKLNSLLKFIKELFFYSQQS